jgi:diguanylate cyclase (GGDEF)-like protein/PAS domain S-box-containing protein
MDNPSGGRWSGRFRESNLRFRYKVMLGVSVAVAISLFAGANAIFNVRRVEQSVSFSAEAASPLLIGVISLSESYQKLQSVFDPVIRNCAGLEGATRLLANSQAEQKAKLDGLKLMALETNALKELKRYEFSGQKIFRTRQALIDLCHDFTTVKSHFSSAKNSIRTATNVVGLNASRSVFALERRITDLWRKKHAPMPRGTLADYDHVRNLDSEIGTVWRQVRDFYKIRILVTELSDASTVIVNTTKPFELDRRRRNYLTKLRAFEKTVRDTRPYYESIGRGPEFAGIAAMVGQTKLMFDEGPRSLLKSAARLQDIEGRRQSLVERLQREQGQYSVALLNIMDVAQRINRRAQAQTEKDANWASWEIGGTMAAFAIFMLLVGWYFKNTVTRPLEILTGNVDRLRMALREDDDPVDQALLKRSDEIGDLAIQFSRTFRLLSQARRELQEASRAEISLQRDRLHGAIENMPQGLYMFDSDGRIIVANRRLAQIYNLGDRSELTGLTVREFVALCRENGAGVKRVISDETDRSGGRSETSHRVVELDDGRIMTMKVMPLPDGGSVVTHEDITEKQLANEKIAHMALHDALTGLANRVLFRRHVDEAIEASGEAGAALLFLDLDRFKVVNDTLGHPVGDALLVEVAERFRRALGEDCFAARLGGDEFAIYHVGDDEDGCGEELARRITACIAEPFEIEGHHIVIGTSIGIALSPRDGRDADELLKNADMALYRAKQEGKGGYRFFEPDMDRRMRDWHEMERDLRAAIAENQFELYYQPLVSLEDERILAFEALIRWHHPRRGFVSPADFIPVAEETGLINEIGGWVLQAAAAQALSWPSDVSVAVNVSPVQFQTGQLQFRVVSALDKSGLPPQRLLLEITEGVFLQDGEQTETMLNDLKALGVRFAMDDFGTGYSSLSYIRRFPFDKIKIDQSFVRGLSDNPESMAIVRAVTNLCRDLGMQTTAEGVETDEHATILRGLGCDTAQGYYFGRPMRAADTMALFDQPGMAVG